MSRRVSIAAVGAGLVASAAALGAAAAVRFDPDLMTVSGRFEVPAAKGALTTALKVVDAQADPAEAQALGVDAAALDSAFRSSIEASLRNFGYLATPDTARPVLLTFKMASPAITPDKDGVTAVVRITSSAAPDGDAVASACVPASVEASYHALTPLKAGGQQKAMGIVAVVALAAVGVNGANLLTGQWETATADQSALNSRRAHTESEGVANSGGERGVTRFAVLKASQLAQAEFIRALGKSRCGAGAAG
jgi:hypothetical protein